VHADQPHHVLVARRQRVRADVEGLVPVVGVVPEADLVVLQEESVVEDHLAGQRREVAALGLQLQVVDPLVAVADFEEQAEAERELHALVDLGLGVLGDERLVRHERVDELQLGQLVVAVHGVLGGRLELDALQLLL